MHAVLQKLAMGLPLEPDTGVPPPLRLNDGCTFRVRIEKDWYGQYYAVVFEVDRLIARLEEALPPGLEPDEAQYMVHADLLWGIIADGKGVAGYLHDDKLWPLGVTAPGLFPPEPAYGSSATTPPPWVVYEPEATVALPHPKPSLKELLQFKEIPLKDVPKFVVVDSLPASKDDLR